MAEKKSLVTAMDEARRLSIERPTCTYWVMDKLRQKARCHGSDWCVRELLIKGWHIHCEFKNGRMV